MMIILFNWVLISRKCLSLCWTGKVCVCISQTGWGTSIGLLVSLVWMLKTWWIPLREWMGKDRGRGKTEVRGQMSEVRRARDRDRDPQITQINADYEKQFWVLDFEFWMKEKANIEEQFWILSFGFWIKMNKPNLIKDKTVEKQFLILNS